MEFAVLLMAVIVLGLLGWGMYRVMKRQDSGPPATGGRAETQSSTLDDSTYRVSYAPPEFEWSGTTTGALPVKILTYKQYECLEDARYGFRIVGLPPIERKQPQPHKTRAHGLKTVASLKKHGFLEDDGEGGYLITDRGLNALEVCSVRY
ncbi:MAG TPA: hypothetical protein PK060_07545 [Polaromonas sp.]|uniref:hypothetical protein n=1 Tax=unclassified Polaromonas TaxID=2638319 RepID=UPI000BCB2943|nr:MULTISPECIES: hypothetical protein [unclassified Polaromonas]OYY33130.1 MAG: hypothetical protein B7Y60_19795 [Polaromonas sp. 35-63-35]OYZ17314.1 MAG: hypothetical protein B7Y28_19595 [Polaromonas sp. 16-63-31]OYZ76547.1 MAG: hypothetical protein B7Y09_19790 [Polaromonas sp. 24-63-21]OZA47678.1 MAG: hypothetical protein B7X88_20930 [Polaromonas sp. 17-63-33]OZA85791.1 MAG: hypothetical protein B7X65_20215 [Polaromonas sp. 39-63-25]